MMGQAFQTNFWNPSVQQHQYEWEMNGRKPKGIGIGDYMVGMVGPNHSQ